MGLCIRVSVCCQKFVSSRRSAMECAEVDQLTKTGRQPRLTQK